MIYKRGKVATGTTSAGPSNRQDGTEESFRIRQSAKMRKRKRCKGRGRGTSAGAEAWRDSPERSLAETRSERSAHVPGLRQGIPAIRQDAHKAGDAHVLQRVP